MGEVYLHLHIRWGIVKLFEGRLKFYYTALMSRVVGALFTIIHHIIIIHHNIPGKSFNDCDDYYRLLNAS